MTNAKKNKDVAGQEAPAETSTAAKQGPVKTFRADDVSASIFAREYKGRTFYSVSFTRSFKDPSGAFKYVKSFDADDLGKVVSVAQQAAEYLHGLMQEAQ